LAVVAGTDIHLRVYDITGTCVKTLSNGAFSNAVVTWDGRNSAGQLLPAGVYFLQLQTPTACETQKLIMVR